MHFHHHNLQDLWHVLWHDGGCVMLPLFMLALWIGYLAWDLTLWLWGSECRKTEDRLWRRWVAEPGSAKGEVGEILSHVLRGGRDPKVIRHRFEEVTRAHLPWVNRRLDFLGVLVTSAPLLGLLGTVLGMLDTFAALADHSGQTLERISSGISEALITTEVGLLIAVPGYLALYWVKRQRDRLKASLLHLESLVLQGVPDGMADRNVEEAR